MKTTDRKLILHIGLPKTGSSSLQRFLRENETRFAKQNIFYPPTFMDSSNQINKFSGHPALVAATASEMSLDIKPSFLPNFLRNAYNIHSDQDAKVFQRVFRRRFETYVSKIKSGTIILSSEQFSTSVRRPKHFTFLKKFIEEYFSEFKIVVYLRPQEDWINSRFSQITRLGGDVSLEDLISAKPNDYYEFLKPWWQCFGKSNLDIRILDKEFLKSGDLLYDFFRIAGGKNFPKFSKPPRANVSFSNQAVYFMHELNKRSPQFENIDTVDVKSDRSGLEEFLEIYSEFKHNLLIDGKQMREIREKYQASNENLRALFFPYRKELFPLNLIVENVNNRLTTEDAVDISALLWEKQENRIRNLQKKNKKLRRELAKKNKTSKKS